MSKKEKLGVGKIVKRVNKEFEKTTEQIEALISDALKQLDHLQNQLQEPIRKILDEMDRIREREFARFQDEFDRRVQEFQELQNSLLDRVGLPGHSRHGKNDSTPAVPAPEKPQVKSPASAPKPAKKKSASAKSSKAPAKQQASAQSESTASGKAKAEPRLSDIHGVGPATIKKMQGAGIASVKQIANPTPEEKKKLEQFASMKGYDSWQDQARKLLG